MFVRKITSQFYLKKKKKKLSFFPYQLVHWDTIVPHDKEEWELISYLPCQTIEPLLKWVPELHRHALEIITFFLETPPSPQGSKGIQKGITPVFSLDHQFLFEMREFEIHFWDVVKYKVTLLFILILNKDLTSSAGIPVTQTASGGGSPVPLSAPQTIISSIIYKNNSWHTFTTWHRSNISGKFASDIPEMPVRKSARERKLRWTIVSKWGQVIKQTQLHQQHAYKSPLSRHPNPDLA